MAACESANPTLGGSPSGYIAPLPTERFASITFETDPAETQGLVTIRQDVTTRNSETRPLLIFVGQNEYDTIPAGGWYNTVTQQRDDAARTITFSTRQPLYFGARFMAAGTVCHVGFSFKPAFDANYRARLRADSQSCWVELVDTSTGLSPSSLAWHHFPL